MGMNIREPSPSGWRQSPLSFPTSINERESSSYNNLLGLVELHQSGGNLTGLTLSQIDLFTDELVGIRMLPSLQLGREES